MAWADFRREFDLLEASHRGLQRHLIPQWVREPKSLSDRLESSAYGETPPTLIKIILDALEIEPDELFVDLGCGAGNVCAAALARRARVLGIERNPELLSAAKAFLARPCPSRLELRCADFLKTDWSHAQVAYTTSARFPPLVLKSLARSAEEAPMLRAIAALGRPLPLSQRWSQEPAGEWPVTWNPGEATLREPLFLYLRRPPNRS